jgi:hypothetical protein
MKEVLFRIDGFCPIFLEFENNGRNIENETENHKLWLTFLGKLTP